MTEKNNHAAAVNTKYEALLSKALVQLKKLKAENKALKEERCEVGITGISCRLPESDDNYDLFWKNLLNKVDCAAPIPGDRLSETFHGRKKQAALENASYIEQPYSFDQAFFNIPAIEATNMDPQHRLLLQETFHALEDACIVPESIQGKRVGVFIGMMNQDYLQASMQSPDSLSALTPLGNSMGVAAGRISHYFDFNGPSIGLDTNCSSSLVALELAQKSLQSYECELAIVGGVNLLLLPTMTEIMSKASALSADGRSKSFAECADGYGRGEGCAVVVLERITDADSRGAPVACKLLAARVQHDGHSSGLSVPNGLAQQRLIRETLAQADLSADDIDYIEAHGTGTALGDPIELDALQSVFEKRTKPLYLGSLKSNIGHLEAAAGLAGLIKVILSLKHSAIPPTLHALPPTERFDWQHSHLKLVDDTLSWLPADKPRRAGISSFGFGGTLAHAIIEEAPERARPEAHLPARCHELLCLSAKSKSALLALRDKYCDFLSANSLGTDSLGAGNVNNGDINNPTLGDITYSAALSRTHYSYRLSVQGSSPDALVQALNGVDKVSEALSDVQTAWLFSGQGAQYEGMGKALYKQEPVFRHALDNCAELLAEELEYSLLDLLWGDYSEHINETQYTQPALFALGYSLAELWRSWGHTPSVVMGHSVGEYIAACVAGVFDLASGLRLIAARGRLMQEQTEPGAMAVIFAPAKILESALVNSGHQQISIGAYNGPENTVVSGALEGVDAVLNLLPDYRHYRLPVSRGFHSPLMDSMLEDFRKIAESIDYQMPTLALVSNVTGKIEDRALCNADYWVDHIQVPVQFEKSMQTLAERGTDVYLELGPSHTLIGMGHQCGIKGHWASSLVNGERDRQSILNALSTLYNVGVALDWSAYYRDRGHLKINLPGYAFQGQDFRIPSLQPEKLFSETASDIQLFNAQWLPVQEVFNSLDEEAKNAKDHWLICDPHHLLATDLHKQMADKSGSFESLSLSNFLSDKTKGSKTENNNAFAINTSLVKHLQALTVNGNQYCHIVLLIDNAIAEPSPSFDKNLFQQIENNIQLIMTSLSSILSLNETSPKIKLHIVTLGNSLNYSDQKDLSIAPLPGLVKVLAHEHREVLGAYCHLIKPYSHIEIEKLSQLLLAPQQGMFALQSGQLLSQVIQPLELAGQAVEIKKSAYLITGGLGAIGFAVSKWMALQSPSKLYVIGRSELSGEKQARFDELAKLTDIEYRQLDTADFSSLQHFFDELIGAQFDLKGIIHTAGVLNDGLLSTQDSTAFYRTFPAKVQSSWYLHTLSQSFDLDFFVMFSSLATTFGAAGQGNYASANGFLQALAHHRHSLGQVASTINWGAWEMGMVEALSEQDKQRLHHKGLGFITSEQGIAVLGRLLNSPDVSVVDAAVLHFQRYYDVLNSDMIKTMLQPILAEGVSAQSADDLDMVERVSPKEKNQSLAEDERIIAVHSILVSEINKLLGKRETALSDDEDLLDKGFDSLVVMDLSNAIQKQFDIAFFPREFYANPSIEKLTKHILAELATETDRIDIRKRIDFSISDISQASDLDSIDEGDEKLPSMAFLLSSPRAGSTLLRAMLAGHSQLFAPPELHLLPYYDMAERSVELEKSLQSGLQRAVMELFSMDVKESEQYINDLLEQKRTIREVYSELIKASGNKLLIDKSPTYAISPYTLSRAEDLFDKPKYIYLVRHPYSVIDSFVQLRMDKFASMLAGEGQESPYEVAEKSWTISNKNITEFIKNNNLSDRVHVLRYEDLVANPIDEMFSICQFLDVPFEQSLLTPFGGDRMSDGIYKDTTAIGDPNFNKHTQIEAALGEKWKSLELPRLLENTSYTLARTLGYDCPQEEATASYQPSAIAPRETFILRDNITLCLHEWGDSSAKPIVLLHGILEQGLVWEPVAQQLAEQGFWVIAPDLRGHVKSQWQGSLHLSDYIDDLRFAVSTYIQQPVTLVAHSFGAMLASFYAYSAMDQVSSLLLIESFVPKHDGHEAALQLLKNPVAENTVVAEFDSVEELTQRLMASQSALDPAFAQRLAERAHTLNDSGKVVWNYNKDLMIRKINTLGFDQALFKKAILSVQDEIPTQFLFSKKEKNYVLFNELFSSDKALDITRIEGGHNLHIDSPLLVVDAVIRLINSRYSISKPSSEEIIA